MSAMKNIIKISFLFSLLFASCGTEEKSMKVTATAYNSTVAQTDNSPNLTAWQDTLRPGQKVIAVSRDLLDSGLTEGTKVRIEGLEGEFTVKDKMHYRWKKKIDIYMGKDIERAREWGEKEVTITWNVED